MDAVQKQIIALSHKIDTLYQIIDQLNSKMAESLTEIRQIPRQQSDAFSSSGQVRPHSYQSQSLLDSVMEHKDVLMDGKSELTHSQQNSENALSADIQVQRLTAQLTAAYNRIAALEEQLLARRIHS
jgi:predicted  nucleic acid-binding Zn-ribbon protein